MEEKGEGLQNIGFAVKDFKESVRIAERMGLKVTQGWQREDGPGFACLDSEKVGGIIFEMIQWPPQQDAFRASKEK